MAAMTGARRGDEVPPPPCEPGMSPFLTKGLSYRGIMEFLTAKGAQFSSQVLQRVSPELRTFYGQPFLAASHYDVLPIRCLTASIAWQLGVSHASYLRMGATKQARSDARTVYRQVVALAPAEMLRRQASLKYYSFLDTECVVSEGEHAARLTVQGMPEYLASWYASVQEGYLAEALRQCGATVPSVQGRVAARRKSQPLEPIDIVFDLSWTPGERP